jgi:signal transduction histidine kinase
MNERPDPLTLDILEGNIQLLAEKERLEIEKLRLQVMDQLKTQFFARVNHDLRTPLNGIIGFSELLMSDTTMSPKQAEFISAIHRNGYALLALINDLLDAASIESGQFNVRSEPSSLQLLVDDVRIATSSQLSLSRHQMVWPDPKALAGKTATLDRRRMVQAIINLVDNARKFTPEGCEIGLTITVEPTQVVFVVYDKGPGISEKDRDRIGRSFFQRAAGGIQRGGGLGLGLSIVRGIVERHGGQMELDSAVGQGTKFRIVIPQQTA